MGPGAHLGNYTFEEQFDITFPGIGCQVEIYEEKSLEDGGAHHITTRRDIPEENESALFGSAKQNPVIIIVAEYWKGKKITDYNS